MGEYITLEPPDTEYQRVINSPGYRLPDDIKKLLCFAAITVYMTPVERIVFLLRTDGDPVVPKRLYTQKSVAEIIERSPRTVRRLERSAYEKIPVDLFG